MSTRWQHSILAVVCLTGLVSLNFAAEEKSDFTAAKQDFLRETRKKSAIERAKAVTAFAAYPEKETAELIWKRAVLDTEPAVRTACRDALWSLVDQRGPRQFLLEEMQRQLKKPNAEVLAAELLRILVITEDEALQTELVKLLDETFANPKGNLLPVMTVIDDFGTQADPVALRALKLFARAAAFERLFGYRRCVVQALIKNRDPESIPYLIELIPKSKGLIHYEIIQHLTASTGQKFRDLERDWRKWWQENQKTFKFPPPNAIATRDPLDDKLPTYYNIPICAKRVVFVLDTSGSMRGEPIVQAKEALLKALEKLPEDVHFGLVFFDARPTVCAPRLVAASPAAKNEAATMIANRGLAPGTASHAALTAAMELQPEVIYFLSDGEPTDGAPLAIVNQFTQMNRTRRVSVHTIGVVTYRNAGAGLTFFMQPLAEQNWGTFRLVE